MELKPFITYVGDYHEFSIDERVLDHAGFVHVRYLEIGYGHSDLGKGYHAIFYSKVSEWEQYVEEWKKLILRDSGNWYDDNFWISTLSLDELKIKDIIE